MKKDIDSSRIITHLGKGNTVNDYEIYQPQLVQNLILFNYITIESTRLFEIANLVKIIGMDLTLELFRTDCIKIDVHAASIGATDTLGVSSAREIVLNPVVVRPASHEDYIHRSFKSFDFLKDIPGVKIKHIVALKKEILRCLHKPNPERKSEALDHAYKEFNDVSILKSKIVSVARKIGNVELNVDKLRFEIYKKENAPFKISNNICEISSCSTDIVYKIIRQSLFELTHKYQALELMHEFGGILPLKREDFADLNSWTKSLLNDKSQISTTGLLHIAEIQGFPNLNDPKIMNSIDFAKLLEIRNHQNIAEFRKFSFESSNKEPGEIKDVMNSLSSRIKTIWHHDATKILKIGFASSFSPAAGVGYALFEEFFLNKIIKKDIAVSFINEDLPRIFVEPTE